MKVMCRRTTGFPPNLIHHNVCLCELLVRQSTSVNWTSKQVLYLRDHSSHPLTVCNILDLISITRFAPIIAAVYFFQHHVKKENQDSRCLFYTRATQHALCLLVRHKHPEQLIWSRKHACCVPVCNAVGLLSVLDGSE